MCSEHSDINSSNSWDVLLVEEVIGEKLDSIRIEYDSSTDLTSSSTSNKSTDKNGKLTGKNNLRCTSSYKEVTLKKGELDLSSRSFTPSCSKKSKIPVPVHKSKFQSVSNVCLSRECRTSERNKRLTSTSHPLFVEFDTKTESDLTPLNDKVCTYNNCALKSMKYQLEGIVEQVKELRNNIPEIYGSICDVTGC